MFDNGGDQNLDEFTQELFTKLLSATRISNNLPTEDEYQFYASFKPFKNKMNELGKRLLDLTQNFLQHDENTKAPIINDSDDVDEVTEKFDEVVDFVDRLIEKVDLYAEESSGDKPKSNIVITKVTAPSRGGAKADYNIFHSTNLPRPQLQFADEIDNSPTPFIPKITYKPNALVPLDPLIVQGQASVITKSDPPNLGQGGFYPHPYEYELRSLQFLDSQLASRPEIIYKSLEDTPYTWVDTVEGLQMVAAALDKADEIAIDLEAHAYHSFQGFVCLMQISTRREDFIIDTLVLRQHLHILNSSFTNPSIVKVLHGSDGDILWLQRDFGIYIVNLFDTGQASRVLEYPSFGLAYLLKLYCNVDADKKYQLADWRIRELPDEMIKYAREDTHYLLYVYDRMRNELVSRGNTNNNFLLSVLNRSKDLCMRRYEKERVDETSHLMLYNKILPNHTTIFNALQMKVFAALYAWRDSIARKEDESTRCVLPNQMMFEIAAQMPLDPPSLYTCCAPVPPPLVRTHEKDILLLIKRTKQQQQGLPQPQQSIVSDSPAPSPSLSSRPFFPNLHLYNNPQSSHLPSLSHPSSLSQPLKYSSSSFPPSSSTFPSTSSFLSSSLPDSPAPHTTKNAETPIANGYNTHTNTPSPVLTTEQLYRTAGWLTEDDPDRDSLFKQSNDDTPATPSSPITPRTRRKAILAKASTGVLFSAQSSSDSSDGGGEEEDEAKRTAALIRSSFTSIVQASFPSFAAMVAPSSSIPQPAKVASSSGSSSAKEENEADGDDESEIKVDADEASSSDETKQQQQASGGSSSNSTAATGDTPPTKKVPRSMAEIYKLSNQNRKRNKEKKKLKEDSLNNHPSSPVVLDENSETSPVKTKKQKTNHKRESEKEKEDKKEKEEKERASGSSGAGASAGAGVEEGEDTVQFMKEIGWITKSAEAKTTTNTTSSSSNNSNTNNNNNNNNVQSGNASGSGDVKSSASHAGKAHHAPAHAHHAHHAHADAHHHAHEIASSPPRKSRPAQQQQSPKQPPARTQPHHAAHHPHAQQPMQHIAKTQPHHAGAGPNAGHSGAPLPNFQAFDYNAAPNFGMAAHQLNTPNPGNFFNPYANSAVSSQSRVNPNSNLRRAPAGTATFRPQTHQRGGGRP